MSKVSGALGLRVFSRLRSPSRPVWWTAKPRRSTAHVYPDFHRLAGPPFPSSSCCRYGFIIIVYSSLSFVIYRTLFSKSDSELVRLSSGQSSMEQCRIKVLAQGPNSRVFFPFFPFLGPDAGQHPYSNSTVTTTLSSIPYSLPRGHPASFTLTASEDTYLWHRKRTRS